MLIKALSINIHPNLQNSIITDKTPHIRMQGSYSTDIITFSASARKKLYTKEYQFFNDFIKQTDANKDSLDKILKNSINSENLLGEGANSKVYRINNIDGFVVKVSKDANNVQKMNLNEITALNNPFDNINFGQPIAKVNDNLLILKKQKGEEHSIKNWSHFISNRNEITKEHAEEFLKDIKVISKMPKSSFEKLADSINILSAKGYKVDSYNPNNLLIDKENNAINVIDYYEKPNEDYKNSSFDMVCSLLDFALFEQYYNRLDKFQQKELIDLSREIIGKCFDARIVTDKKNHQVLLGKTDMYENKANNYQKKFKQFSNLVGLDSLLPRNK